MIRHASACGHNGVGDVGAEFEVPICRLESIAARCRIRHVRLLKVDVEGYEREVCGAAETLCRSDHIVFECLPESRKYVVQDIRDVLSASGFVLRQVDGPRWDPGEPSIENNIWASRRS